MKYKQQKPNYGNCGPLAIYNAMIWLQRKPRLRDLEFDCKLHPINGTNIIDITKVLKKNQVNFKHHRHIRTIEIIRALQDGCAVIYLYGVSDRSSHYTLFTNATKKRKHWYFNVVNDWYFGWDEPERMVQVAYYRKKIVKLGPLFRSQGFCNPQAWILKKGKAR